MIQFGTDGWRAIIGLDYTYDNVAQVVQAWADLQENKDQEVVLGYDRRFSSRLFAEHAAKVLLGNGFKVLMSDQFCPTPAVSWMVKDRKALAGVVITASHNPFQWNGVKFKESYGGSASPAYCQKIEEQAKNNLQIQLGDLAAAQKNGQLNYFSPLEAYANQLASFVDLEKIKASKIKILVDSLYGAGAGFIKQLLPDQVIEIRCEENPAFPGINPEPIDLNMGMTMDCVKNQGFDLALVTDGDADRIGALDENAIFVNSHQIFSLILRHLIQEKGKKGDVVKTVSTTQMINRIGQAYGLRVEETAIGFKHICNQFLILNPLMGGEESGGIGIADHVYERDGLLCGLFLAEIVATHQKPLSQIIQDLQAQYGPLYFKRHDLALAQDKIKKLKEDFALHAPQEIAGRKVAEKNFADGFKFIFADGAWLLIRPSGTEPLLRVYSETASAAETESILAAALELVEKY